MATKKTLNIGLIGGGFMGRTHSNGYRRVANFFPDLQYTPVLKAVCFRNETKLKAFAEQWGYESVETDWRKLLTKKCLPSQKRRESIEETDVDTIRINIVGEDGPPTSQSSSSSPLTVESPTERVDPVVAFNSCTCCPNSCVAF